MARVTIVCVPREVFSQSRMSLESLLANTELDYQLVYVDGGSPPETRRYLDRAAREHGFTLIRTDHYLSPNQARNLALDHVDSPYVAFLDNDVVVERGWLRALVECAEASGAWAVSPLIFEHLPAFSRIHLAGGQCQLRVTADGRRYFHERHYLAHKPLAEVGRAIVRERTELIELHAVLLQTEALRRVGGFDEGLLNHAEHADLSLLIAEHGGHIVLEPKARVTYVPPRSLNGADRDFFELRWSEAWSAASLAHFNDKWRLDPGHSEVERARKWMRAHRRYGSRVFPQVRKTLGWRLSQVVERAFLDPLEVRWNRYRFPASYFTTRPRPTVRTTVANRDQETR